MKFMYGGSLLKEMEKELSQYSYKTIQEFEKIFPLPRLYDPPGTNAGGKYGKYHYYSQNIIPKEGKAHIVNVTMLYKDTYEETYQIFWSRWNRFKNLRVFL